MVNRKSVALGFECVLAHPPPEGVAWFPWGRLCSVHERGRDTPSGGNSHAEDSQKPLLRNHKTTVKSVTLTSMALLLCTHTHTHTHPKRGKKS